jgi:copper homeostasis protein
MSMMVEICIDSLASARAAADGGADRIELCADLPRGGTTPSAGLIENVRKLTSLDIRVLVRPRPGDFVYSSEELGIMERDIAHAKILGADGVVIGVLDADGNIDRDAMRSLIAKARPMRVTFHRAFDVVSDASVAIEVLAEIGIDLLLTSGRHPTASEGRDGIRDVVQRSRGRFRVMVGSGLNLSNVGSLVQFTGVQDVHVGSGVTRKINNSSHPLFSEESSIVDAGIVRSFRRAAFSAAP